MADFNNLILCGRATAAAEIRTTQSGFRVMRFHIAVNRGGKDSNKPLFIPVACWNEKLMDAVHPMIKKGTQLIAQGELGLDQWKDDYGKDKERPVMVMHMNSGQIQILTPKDQNTGE